MRRLTSKCVSRAVHQEAVSILSPLQVGVGIPLGCESIVHSVSSFLSNPDIHSHSKCSLFVDFSNAFNSVDRTHMFREVRSRIPEMAAWVESCYSSQPTLLFGDYELSSCAGVQQGDPLGPLCFALSLHPLVEKIQATVPDLLLNVWYLDDGTLCGPPNSLSAAFSIIESFGPPLGLFLNKSKSFIFFPENSSISPNSFPSGVPTTNGGLHPSRIPNRSTFLL